MVPSITLRGSDVRFALASNEARYEGKLSDDGASITGTFTQNSQSFALNFVRVSDKDAWVIPKPKKMMAKDADPSFEVATIKPGAPYRLKGSGFGVQGRHITVLNYTLRDIISYAYSVHKKQITGGPAWFGADVYDIDGVADIEGQPNLKQQQEMYKKLLADRFKLTIHTEKNELSVYALNVGKNGPKLTKSLGDPNGPSNDAITEWSSSRIVLQETNASMEDFAFMIATDAACKVDRPVVDQTGLTGRFDFTLKWRPDDSTTNDPNALPGLFTAIQEQLGLKMEATKAMVDVIVIDKVERPSAN